MEDYCATEVTEYMCTASQFFWTSAEKEAGANTQVLNITAGNMSTSSHVVPLAPDSNFSNQIFRDDGNTTETCALVYEKVSAGTSLPRSQPHAYGDGAHGSPLDNDIPYTFFDSSASFRRSVVPSIHDLPSRPAVQGSSRRIVLSCTSILPSGEEASRDVPGRLGQHLWIWVVLVKLVLAGIYVSTGFLIYWNRVRVANWLIHIHNIVSQSLPTGIFIFCLVSATAVSLLFPAELLMVVAGYLFTRSKNHTFMLGYFVGVASSFIALLLSCVTTFLVGRYCFRPCARGRMQNSSLFSAFAKGLRHGGIRVVALLRLSPFVPFSVSNYLLGLCNVPLSSVLIGFPFCLPMVIVTVYLGSAVSAVEDIWLLHWDSLRIMTVIFGALATMAALTYIWKLTTTQLHHTYHDTAAGTGPNHECTAALIRSQ